VSNPPSEQGCAPRLPEGGRKNETIVFRPEGGHEPVAEVGVSQFVVRLADFPYPGTTEAVDLILRHRGSATPTRKPSWAATR